MLSDAGRAPVVDFPLPEADALLDCLQLRGIGHVLLADPRKQPPAEGARAPLSIAVSAAALDGMPALLQEFCGAHAMELVHHYHDRDGAQVFTLAWWIQGRVRQLVLKVSCGRLGRWQRLRWWWRAQREPSGLFVACLGPDGSGKGRVIAQLGAHPLALFDRTHTMDLRPRLMHPVPAQPESRVPRGSLGTTAKLLMFLVDYWLGYWLQIRPLLVRSTLILSNRYYDDILVDPLRYRIDRPRPVARLLLAWIPRPELWLVFDAPGEALQRRGSAPPAAEALRQRGEYRRVLRRHQEDVVALDARQDLEALTAQAQRAILAQLARRTAHRLGLVDTTPVNARATRVLLFFSRRRIPVLSRVVRVLFNSDIQCRLPDDARMPHPYGIVIHAQAVIGHRVTIMQQVMIGGRDPEQDIAPVIGDDVHIGAGARLLGDVRIGKGAVIGANAVVTEDVPEGATVVGANRIVTVPEEAVAAAPLAQFPLSVHQGGRS